MPKRRKETAKGNVQRGLSEHLDQKERAAERELARSPGDRSGLWAELVHGACGRLGVADGALEDS